MYQSTKSLVDDLSRREVETSQYGEQEPWRVFEDVYDVGVWPNEHCSPDSLCAECVGADQEEINAT